MNCAASSWLATARSIIGRAAIWPEFDAIRTAAPPLAITGNSASTRILVAPKLIANTCSPSAIEGDTPAAWTSAAILRLPSVAMIRSAKSASVTLPATVAAPANPAANAASGSACKSLSTRDQPCCAKAVAMAEPMPPAAPVITATLSGLLSIPMFPRKMCVSATAGAGPAFLFRRCGRIHFFQSLLHRVHAHLQCVGGIELDGPGRFVIDQHMARRDEIGLTGFDYFFGPVGTRI